MANPEHVAKLNEGVDVWNAWRSENSKVVPDFRGTSDRVWNDDSTWKDPEDFGGTFGPFSIDATGANLDRVDIRTAFNPAKSPKPQDALITNRPGDFMIYETMLVPIDLNRFANITQSQVDTMRGDRFTIIPEHLSMPQHWEIEPVEGFDDTSYPIIEEPDAPARTDESARGPELPNMKTQSITRLVSIVGDKVSISSTPLEDRTDLQSIYMDLREDLADLGKRFGNISPSFAKLLDRYTSILSADYNDVDQIRFGTQTAGIRTRFAPLRANDVVGGEDVATIDTILMQADLILQRSPDWQAFLKEAAPTKEVIKHNDEEIIENVLVAASAMEDAPEHFDSSVPQTITDYIDTLSLEGYMAATATLNAIVFKICVEVQKDVRATMSKARDLIHTGLAAAMLTGLGIQIARLAGLMPAEFGWALPWLEYIPTLIGV